LTTQPKVVIFDVEEVKYAREEVETMERKKKVKPNRNSKKVRSNPTGNCQLGNRNSASTQKIMEGNHKNDGRRNNHRGFP
jgi:hypothetical protein